MTSLQLNTTNLELTACYEGNGVSVLVQHLSFEPTTAEQTDVNVVPGLLAVEGAEFLLANFTDKILSLNHVPKRTTVLTDTHGKTSAVPGGSMAVPRFFGSGTEKTEPWSTQVLQVLDRLKQCSAEQVPVLFLGPPPETYSYPSVMQELEKIASVIQRFENVYVVAQNALGKYLGAPHAFQDAQVHGFSFQNLKLGEWFWEKHPDQQKVVTEASGLKDLGTLFAVSFGQRYRAQKKKPCRVQVRVPDGLRRLNEDVFGDVNVVNLVSSETDRTVSVVAEPARDAKDLFVVLVCAGKIEETVLDVKVGNVDGQSKIVCQRVHDETHEVGVTVMMMGEAERPFSAEGAVLALNAPRLTAKTPVLRWFAHQREVARAKILQKMCALDTIAGYVSLGCEGMALAASSEQECRLKRQRRPDFSKPRAKLARNQTLGVGGFTY